MSLTVHSDSSHNPRYWVTENNLTIFSSDDAVSALQYAMDTGNLLIRADGTFTVNRPIHLHGVTFSSGLIHPNQWHRICSRCNGPIYKGEGKIIGRCKTDGCTTWQHKKYGLCQKFKYGE